MASSKTQAVDSVAKKINSSFLVSESELPRPVHERAFKMVSAYGDYCQNFTWYPNASAYHENLSPPSGFSMAVELDAPVIADIFSPKKLFYGTIALPLDNVKLTDGTSLTEEYIIKNFRDIASRVGLKVGQTVENPFNMNKSMNKKEFIDSSNWSPSLGGGGSYAGLFSSRQKAGYFIKNRLWIVVQSGNTEASIDLYRKIEDAAPTWDVSKISPAKNTWENFFEGNRENYYLYNVIRRSRERLMASIADAIGLNLPFEMDDYAKEPTKTKILKPLVSTMAYSITRDGDKMVYAAAAANPSKCPNGFLLNENPYSGVSILKGPEEQNREFGGIWSTAEGTNGMFPTSTGRVKPLTKNSGAELLKQAKKIESSKFFVDAENIDTKTSRMAPYVYRERNNLFRQKEAEMNYSHTWGEERLEPVLVRLCS